MSAKSILEADGKAILNYHLTRAPVIKPTPLPPSATHNPAPRLASLYFPEDADVKSVLDQAELQYPWLLHKDAKFVAKPDQLIKRRGKSGLLALNKTWAQARDWIQERAGKSQRVETVDGVLRRFLVEPFVPHPQETEYYICIQSVSCHEPRKSAMQKLTSSTKVREVRIHQPFAPDAKFRNFIFESVQQTACPNAFLFSAVWAAASFCTRSPLALRGRREGESFPDPPAPVRHNSRTATQSSSSKFSLSCVYHCGYSSYPVVVPFHVHF